MWNTLLRETRPGVYSFPAAFPLLISLLQKIPDTVLYEQAVPGISYIIAL